jgi:hypothetical protein
VARSTGIRCRAAAAVGDLCWDHGAGKVKGPLAMTFERGQPVLGRLMVLVSTARRRETWPKTASKWGAVQLIKRGVIVRGMFAVATCRHMHAVRKFEARVEAEGVTVNVVRESPGLRVVEFEVQRDGE